MKLIAMFLCLAATLGFPAANHAQTVDTIDPALKSRIDRIATQVLEQTGVPSASVAVVKGGKLVYTHAYGKARLEPPTPATPDMRYSIGSISKQFTAAAILLLQEQGKLSLDDTVGKYVPGLTRGDEVTIRQILSHTSGYQDYWPEDYVMTPMLHDESAQQILDTWAKKPLDFEPGTQWQYSNTNFVIAGAIVEKVSGQKLMDFLVEHIFHPLGMKSVWNSDETKLTQADATAYYRHALGPLRVAPKEGRGWMFAAGELAMTAHDLALWDESLIAQTLLKPESYKQMFTEVKLKDGKGTHYGLGVEVIDRNGHRSIEHSGEVSGFVSDNEVLVDDGAAVAVLTNQDAVGAASTIARLAAPVVAGYPPNPRGKAGSRHLPRPAAGPDRSQSARAESQRLLHPGSNCGFPVEPCAAWRAAHIPQDRRRAARRHDLPVVRHRLSRKAPAPHDLHLPRRQTRAVPDRASGVTGCPVLAPLGRGSRLSS